MVSGPVSDTATENDAVFGVDFLSGTTDVDTSDSLTIANLNLTGGNASGITPVGNALSVDPSVYKSLAAGETEVISYTYDVVDNQGGVTPQTATITIVGTNDAPVVTDATITAAEDSLDVPLLLPLPTDLDVSDTLTITVTGLPNPALGSVTLSDGTPLVNGQALTLLEFQGLQFDTVPNTSGSSTFTYTVTDGMDTVPGTATITISGSNDAPVAIDNQYTTNEDASFTGNVLTNNTGAGVDSDPDGDALSVTAVNGQPSAIGASIILSSGATLTLQSDGGFIYNPSTSATFNTLPLGSSTTDSFDYTVSDGNGGSDTATVTLTINGANDGITAVADLGATDQGSVLSVNALSGVLNNDTDLDGDSLSVSDVNGTGGNVGTQITLGSGALVTLNADGSYDYDPNSMFDGLAAGATTTDSFTYTVVDGNGASATETVTITITGTNEAPVATVDANTAQEDVTLVATGNVLLNDTDQDTSDSINVANPGTYVGAYGSLVLNADGSYTYTLNNSAPVVQGLAGGDVVQDIFNYTVDDSNGGLDSSTLTITVNGTEDTPVISGTASGAVTEDGVLSATGTLATSDADAADTPTFTVTSRDSRYLR